MRRSRVAAGVAAAEAISERRRRRTDRWDRFAAAALQALVQRYADTDGPAALVPTAAQYADAMMAEVDRRADVARGYTYLSEDEARAQQQRQEGAE